MIPIYQTKFGKPLGNCHAACLASVFEIPLESIPDFGNDDYWYEKFIEWCRSELNISPIDIDIDVYENSMQGRKPHGYHLINGISINGDFWHSTVGYNGKIVHDPMPGISALKEAKTYTLFIDSCEV